MGFLNIKILDIRSSILGGGQKIRTYGIAVIEHRISSIENRVSIIEYRESSNEHHYAYPNTQIIAPYIKYDVVWVEETPTIFLCS